MSDVPPTDKPAGKPPKSPKSPAAKTPRKRAARKSRGKKQDPTPPVEDGQREQSERAARDPSQPAGLIRVPMAVRWRDLDAFNHVNNSKYLGYLEEARLRWMLGLPGQGMDDHVAPVVAAATLNYRRPIAWPAEVLVELFVERLGNTSLTVGHRILAADDHDVLYCDGHVVMVWIDRDSGAAAPLPASVREACS